MSSSPAATAPPNDEESAAVEPSISPLTIPSGFTKSQKRKLSATSSSNLSFGDSEADDGDDFDPVENDGLIRKKAESSDTQSLLSQPSHDDVSAEKFVVELIFEDCYGCENLHMKLLGHRHTWRQIGRLLFSNYIQRIRGEEGTWETLESHIWRVYPTKGNGLALSKDLPILAPRVGFYNPYGYDSSEGGNIKDPRRLFTLKVGDKMQFFYDEGSSTIVDFSVKSIISVDRYSAQDLEAMEEGGPICVNVNNRPMDIDHPFTAEEIEESRVFRVRKANANETEYSRNQKCVIPLRPPSWEPAELEVVMRLIKSGLTFTKAWNSYMIHGLLRRSKECTSGKWYELKKRTSVEIGDKEEHIQRAIVLLRSVKRKDLATPFQYSKFANYEEYLADRDRRWNA